MVQIPKGYMKTVPPERSNQEKEHPDSNKTVVAVKIRLVKVTAVNELNMEINTMIRVFKSSINK